MNSLSINAYFASLVSYFEKVNRKDSRTRNCYEAITLNPGILLLNKLNSI